MKLNRLIVCANSVVAILAVMIYLTGNAMAEPKKDKSPRPDDNPPISDDGTPTFEDFTTPTFQPEPPKPKKKSGGGTVLLQANPTVNLKIHHGRWWDSTMPPPAGSPPGTPNGGYRGGAEVEEHEEESVGAFGCVNWNDTNGNGIMDNQDVDCRPAQTALTANVAQGVKILPVQSTTGFKINEKIVVAVSNTDYEVVEIQAVTPPTTITLKGTGVSKAYNAGVAVKHRGIDEVDLLEVKLEAGGLNGGVVKLRVVAGNVEFWDNTWKGTKSNGGVQIAPNGERIINFTVDAEPWTRTVWMEILQPSGLQGIKLELSNQNAGMDKVNATGVWAQQYRMRNGTPPHTTTSAAIWLPVAAGSTVITVPLGQADRFFVGQEIFVKDNLGADEKRVISVITPGSILSFFFDIITVTEGVSRDFGNFQQGGEVYYLADETRLSCFANGQQIRNTFSQQVKRLGYTMEDPWCRNGVEHQFIVQPLDLLKFEERRYGWGIINLDVSRRIEQLSVVFDSSNPRNMGTWSVSPYPLKSDVANDDPDNVDEDNVPKFGCIYSIDAPGMLQAVVPIFGLPGGGALNTIPWQAPNPVDPITRVVIRLNFEEFVRVSFDGSPITHGNNLPDAQGSRCSPLGLWHSRMDITPGAPVEGQILACWRRNNIMTPTGLSNKTGTGNVPLTPIP